MKIGLSIEHLHGKKTGVGQYGYQIALNLAKLDRKNQYFLFSPSPLERGDRARLASYPNIQLLDHNLLAKVILSDLLLIPLWLQLYLPYLCRRAGIDVYFHTGSIWPLLPIRLARRQAVFVHDVIPLLFPECYHRSTIHYYRVSRSTNLRSYDTFLVNSHSTKRDLMRHLGVHELRIALTPLGKDERFVRIDDAHQRQAVRQKYGLPESYLLFAGTLEPRKNIPRLLEAFAKSKARQVFKLVIAGKKGWLYEEIFRTVKRLHLEHSVIFTGFVDDHDLPSLYSMARLFVYPSLYEGFGLPVLEAMACGAPTITSNVAALPEVAGDAAILVDPLDERSLTRSIDQAVFNYALHGQLCKASIARAREFAWERTAQATLEALLG